MKTVAKLAALLVLLAACDPSADAVDREDEIREHADDGCGGPPPEDSVFVQPCGGWNSLTCPDGYVCIGETIPVDGVGACRVPCSPGSSDACLNGATCVKMFEGCEGDDCVHFCRPAACDLATSGTCVDGFTCVVDLSDSCWDFEGSSECPGICIPG